jgi:hypothetical protein
MTTEISKSHMLVVSAKRKNLGNILKIMNDVAPETFLIYPIYVQFTAEFSLTADRKEELRRGGAGEAK